MRIATFLKFFVLVVVLVIISNFFLNVSELIKVQYDFSLVKKFLPFNIILPVLWIIFFLLLMVFCLVLRSSSYLVNFLIVILPMATLPYVVLGWPLVFINKYFICRSSVVFLVFLLFSVWIANLSLYPRNVPVKLPFLGRITFLLATFFWGFFYVPHAERMGLLQTCLVLISCIMLFYFIINHLTDVNKLDTVLKILVFSCCLQLFFSLPAYFYYINIKGFTVLRIEGILRDYELFAEFLAIHIPLMLFFIRRAERTTSKMLLIVLMFLAVTVLISTQTRGAVIALIIGMSYYFLRMSNALSLGRVLRFVIIGLSMAALAVGLLTWFLPQTAGIMLRFYSTDISTFDTRSVVWQEFARAFVKKPILGYGAVYDFGSYLFYPHSTFFYYLLSVGILGLSAYLFFVWGLFRVSFNNERLAKNDRMLFEVSIVLTSMLIIFFIDSFKIEYTRYSNYQLYIWVLFALIFVLSNIISRKKR